MSDDYCSTPTPLPCASCPWRITRDATTIPQYDHGLAVQLLNTVGDGDVFRPIMACHGAQDDALPAQRLCYGYFAQVGWSNLAVRLLLVQRLLPTSPEAVQAACAVRGIALHATYPEVLAKLAASLGV